MDAVFDFALLLFVILTLDGVRRLSWRFKPPYLPLPPGPKGHWFFGVKKLLPREEPWKTYAAWSKLHQGQYSHYLGVTCLIELYRTNNLVPSLQSEGNSS